MPGSAYIGFIVYKYCNALHSTLYVIELTLLYQSFLVFTSKPH